MPVGDNFSICRVLEAGPQENPDEVAVLLQQVAEHPIPSANGWVYARGRNAMAVLTAALTAMSLSATVSVSFHDDNTIGRFNVKRQ